MGTANKADSFSYCFDDVVVDVANLRVQKNGQVRKITPRPFEVLVYLIEHAGRIVEKQELFEQIWKESFVTDNALTRIIKEVRQAIGDNADAPRYIETVPKHGYRFIAEVKLQEETRPPNFESEGVSLEGRDAQIEEAGTASSLPAFLIGRFKWLIAAAAFCAMAVVSFTIWKQQPRLDPGHNTGSLKTTQITFSSGLDDYPIFSPDGNSIAYSSNQNGDFEIYTRQLIPGAREIQLTVDGKQNFQPAWSPDGKKIAYYSKDRGGVWMIPASGGVPRQLTEFGSRPAWSPDSSVMAFQSGVFTDLGTSGVDAVPPSTIWIVSSRGGSPTPITQVGNPPGGHGSPSWSPDGRRIVFLASDNSISDIWTMTATGEDLRRVTKTKGLLFYRSPIYSPDGETVYYAVAGSGSMGLGLWKVSVSRISSEPAGEAMKILDTGATVCKNLAISADGKKIVYSSVSIKSNLLSVSLTPDANGISGAPVPLTQDTSLRNLLPLISPDGKRIAYAVWRQGTSANVWVMDTEGKNLVQATTDHVYGGFPSWFPEGDKIAFLSNRQGIRTLWSTTLDSGREELLLDIDSNMVFPRLSPDGKEVVFNSNKDGTINLWIAQIQGGQPRQLTFDSETAGFPCWSPDGKLLAFQVKRGDDTHIAVMPSIGGEITQLTSDRGHSWAHSWAPDGDRIAFAGFRNGYWNIWWVSRSTKAQKQLTNYAKLDSYVRYPTWSPLGNQIVYEYAETTGNIWIMELR